MKKLFAFVLTFVLCLSLVGCGGAPAPEVPAPEVPEIPEEEPAEEGILNNWVANPDGKIRICFYEDGTFHYENDRTGTVEDGTYTYDDFSGHISIPSMEGKPWVGNMGDGEFTIYDNFGSVRFSRELGAPLTADDIVHDWIMRPYGDVRLFLYADGTYRYENDNNNKINEGNYTFDPAENTISVPGMNDELFEGFINSFYEVELRSEDGFMLFSRDLDPNYTEPVIEQAVELWGSWTTADGKGTVTFDNGSYEYKESTLTLMGSYVTYEADGTVFVDFSPTGMDFELGTAFFYEADKTLMTLMGNIVFAPDDPSYYPGEGTPPAEIPEEPEQPEEPEEPEPEQPEEDPEEPEEEPEPEYTGPRGFMNGSWASGGKKFTFMGDTYKYDDGTTVSTGKYEVFIIDNGRGLRFIPDAGSQQIPDATITSASLSLFVGGEAFNPKDMNDHPFVGVGG